MTRTVEEQNKNEKKKKKKTKNKKKLKKNLQYEGSDGGGAFTGETAARLEHPSSMVFVTGS